MSEAGVSDTRQALGVAVDVLEEAYHFMLSYAARGRTREEANDPEGNIRPYLENAVAALEDLSAVADMHARTTAIDPEAWRAFATMLAADAVRARTAIALVLSLPSISSLVVDNLNGSLHLRALMSDLFLMDSSLDAAG